MNDPTTAHPTLTDEQARAAVLDALRRIVPDADLAEVTDDTRLRRELELDSLDFLSFVELLGTAGGRVVRETDYARLETLGSCVDYLTT